METDASLMGVELEQKQQEELYQQLLLQVSFTVNEHYYQCVSLVGATNMHIGHSKMKML